MNPFRAKRAQALVDTLGRPEHPAPVAIAPEPRIEGQVATIRLYDVIDSWGGYWGISAKEFATILDGLPSDVTEIRVLVNSPGGEVTEGMAILNQLRAHPAKTVAVVEGIAASAASFIAIGCDELVMMRGTELFIHNAWTITWGNASDLRKVADDLENHFDRNIAQVYADKAGGTIEHWLAEMAKDRYLSADEAVSEGLADRVDGAPSEEAAKARAAFDLSIFAAARTTVAANKSTPKLPSSSEPGNPNRKENLVAYEDLTAGLRDRLGITAADVSDDELLAAVDEIVETATAPANVPAATVPDGTVLVDSEVLANLQADAAQGRAAREEQITARRDGIIAAALADGRITPANAPKWRAQLDAAEDSTKELIESMPKNTVPLAELGTAANPEASADDSVYDQLFPKGE